MALSGWGPPAKRVRTDGEGSGCSACGVVGHTSDNCPFTDLLLEAKAVREVRKPGAMLKKAELCRFHQVGQCKFGDDCVYIHSEVGLKVGGAKTRTSICKFYKWGTCQFGRECSYAHEKADLNTSVLQPMPVRRDTPKGGAGSITLPTILPAELNSAKVTELIQVAEDAAAWLTEAAGYCAANTAATNLENVLENAGEAAQRAIWAHSMVSAYDPPKETTDAAQLATIRNAVIEAKEKAESAYLSIKEILSFKKTQTSSFELFMAQARCNQAGDDWSQKPGPSKLPEVSILSLTCTKGWEQGTSLLAREGFHPEGVAVGYMKNCDLFSEAHGILQTFCGQQYVKDLVSVELDPECTEYPEVYQTWKAQGGDDWPMTIAKCKQLKKWGAGFAGKKNGEKAAKLALGLSIAGAVDSSKLEKVIEYYPEFGRLITGGNY